MDYAKFSTLAVYAVIIRNMLAGKTFDVTILSCNHKQKESNLTLHYGGNSTMLCDSVSFHTNGYGYAHLCIRDHCGSMHIVSADCLVNISHTDDRVIICETDIIGKPIVKIFKVNN